ncbi:PREDICTED: E-selectin isoform X1 [Ceratotherium simum simum]|uniref:E-selectin isoform X1 n=1 Tax=Ceratotherium simum simum TaxID=73337 RepID=A0ABM0HE24_CERSS|nr:PREDICTED: E-selectin isoform X1 [Ceratotherium simum simum]
MRRTLEVMIASQFLSALTLALLFKESGAWSYSASTRNMTFDEASAYCQQRYTHLVAIQNQEEIKYLNSIFSHSPSYYWIGIRKVNNKWVWIGTQKPLTEEAKNWAPGEPNNKQNNEDCVEIYIKRDKDAGKWNDEKCSKKKLALCYTAACTRTSCSGHGECVETINNYTCQCHPGFSGLECEQVVTCQAQEAPEHGHLVCTHPFGNFSYNSSCSVSCEKGYLPSSTEVMQCTSSGEWSAPLPACKVVECDALTNPANGVMECSQGPGGFPWNTTCAFDCEEGFELVGPQHLQCTSSGNWDNEKPTCKAVTCGAIGHPQNGSVSCSHSPAGEFTFNSSCSFTCEEGFMLQGPAQVECTAQGQWTQQIPVCEALQCKALSSPERGYMNCLPSASESFQSGSSCEFSCEQGFVLKGSKKLQCGPTGEWDSEKPACEAVKCDAVRRPQDGLVRCTHSPTGEFTYKSSCVFSCEKGFELRGSAQLECTSQGQWTQEVPSCQVVQCSSLAVPGKVNVSCSGEPVFGAMCTFVCPEGWMLNGSAALTCGATGHWSGMPPTCEAPAESNVPLAVGLSAAGTSLLTLASFLFWLLKRLRKARKFVPASSCQSLQSDGSYQMPSESI